MLHIVHTSTTTTIQQITKEPLLKHPSPHPLLLILLHFSFLSFAFCISFLVLEKKNVATTNIATTYVYCFAYKWVGVACYAKNTTTQATRPMYKFRGNNTLIIQNNETKYQPSNQCYYNSPKAKIIVDDLHFV